MNYPFTTEQFFNVFTNYNQAIWPMQIVAYVLGLLAIVFGIVKIKSSHRIVTGILTFFWLWMGLVYHIMFFTTINKAAYIFGGIFIIQAIIFLIFGLIKGKLSFGFNSNIYWIVGTLFILCAMVIYPILGHLQGHGYPNAPMFGIAPCPATIFTFGILLWSDKKVSLSFFIIPLIWSIIGFLAAVSLGVKEDIGLLVAGVVGTVLILIKNRNFK